MFLRSTKPRAPSDERWRIARDELLDMQERYSRPRLPRWVGQVAKALLAATLFLLTLFFAAALRLNSPAATMHEIQAELSSIGSTRLSSDGGARMSDTAVMDPVVRLEALAQRVENETRINDNLKARLLARIRSEWHWWRSQLQKGSGQPAATAGHAPALAPATPHPSRSH